jgi:hypothetical protein
MPSKIFTSDDILDLVNSFESSKSWNKTDEEPPLIRNTSSSYLFTTQTLTNRLSQVLSESDRKTSLSKTKVAQILDIDTEGLEILLRSPACEVKFDQRGNILPGALLKGIKSSLQDLINTRIVDLNKFAREHDLDLHVLKALVWDELPSWITLAMDGTSPKLDELYYSAEAGKRLHHILSTHVKSADSTSSKTDITALPEFSEYAIEIVRAVWNDGDGKEPRGMFVVEGGHVVYVPDGFVQAEERRRREIIDAHIGEILAVVAREDFCVLEAGDAVLRDAIASKAGEEVAFISTLEQDAKSGKRVQTKEKVYVVRSAALEDSLAKLKYLLNEVTRTRWASGERKFDLGEMMRGLKPGKGQVPSPLDQVIISSGSYSSELEAQLRTTAAACEAADHETYIQLLIDRLLIPVQLYSSGLDIVHDESLKARLSTYATSHLLSETDSLAADFKTQNLLTGPRERDFTKFRSTAAAEISALPALQTAATKLAKKAKWDAQPPSATRTREIKTKILQRTAHAMKPSSTARPSDVLQHALWILLGVANEGVFISAGKDTSRMIALYESIPDADEMMVEKLRVLRDKLKKSEAVDDEVRETRELVRKRVEEFVKGN